MCCESGQPWHQLERKGCQRLSTARRILELQQLRNRAESSRIISWIRYFIWGILQTFLLEIFPETPSGNSTRNFCCGSCHKLHLKILPGIPFVELFSRNSNLEVALGTKFSLRFLPEFLVAIIKQCDLEIFRGSPKKAPTRNSWSVTRINS